MFLSITLDSECCLNYGICGAQFAPDITFDSFDRVYATRFKIQLTKATNSNYYIAGMGNASALVEYYAKDLVLDANTTLNSQDGSILYQMN